VLEIIYEINARFLSQVAARWPGDMERQRRMSLIEESGDPQVRMAYLAIVGSFSVNGVAALHSELLKQGLFRDWYELWPAKFNNKTNGVTPRRWLAMCNPGLRTLLDEIIGKEWVHDLRRLEAYLVATAPGAVCAVPGAEGVAGGAITVLLVDDHVMMRRALAATLEDAPDVVIVGEAADGLQALDMVAQLRPRLVLMDYSMPHMDGIEATRHIRRHWPDVCVIGLSMYQEADRAAAMLGAGARAYVDKTTGADALLRTIRATLTDCAAPQS